MSSPVRAATPDAGHQLNEVTAVRAQAPTLAVESALFSAGAERVVGLDEVGRGALAGPVVVGAVLLDGAYHGPGQFIGNQQLVPEGLRDSKALSAAQRARLCAPITQWARATAVGSASAAEIDEVGIIAALGRASRRALMSLPLDASVILLDGRVDVLAALGDSVPGRPRVVTKIGADRSCASVAAASVLAKVARDGVMARLGGPSDDYRWRLNKGYGTAEHRAILTRLGPGAHHRRTWRSCRPA